MSILRVTAEVDAQHRLHAIVPSTINPGKLEILLLANDDDAGNELEDAWMHALANEWHSELSDPREDLYSLADGAPPNGAG